MNRSRGAPPDAGPGASRAGRTCSWCASPAAVQCSLCKQAYCDPDCQRADWRAGHRFECAPPDDARPASPVEDIPSDSEDPVQALADMIVAARARKAEAERAAKAKADEETADAEYAAVIAAFQETEKALAAKATGPLLGGYTVGEKVFWITESYTFPDGDKLTHGQAGEVKGPSSTLGDEGVAVMFPGNTTNKGCRLTNLSRTPPPPLPGGYAVGDWVYFVGGNPKPSSGANILIAYGTPCEVMGPILRDSSALAVKFSGQETLTSCSLVLLSRTPPLPPPGGDIAAGVVVVPPLPGGGVAAEDVTSSST